MAVAGVWRFPIFDCYTCGEADVTPSGYENKSHQSLRRLMFCNVPNARNNFIGEAAGRSNYLLTASTLLSQPLSLSTSPFKLPTPNLGNNEFTNNQLQLLPHVSRPRERVFYTLPSDPSVVYTCPALFQDPFLFFFQPAWSCRRPSRP